MWVAVSGKVVHLVREVRTLLLVVVVVVVLGFGGGEVDWLGGRVTDGVVVGGGLLPPQVKTGGPMCSCKGHDASRRLYKEHAYRGWYSS